MLLCTCACLGVGRGRGEGSDPRLRIGIEMRFCCYVGREEWVLCACAPLVVERAKGLASVIGALAISFAKAEVLYVVLVECLSYVHAEGLASGIVDKAIMSHIHARRRRARRRFFVCRACRMSVVCACAPSPRVSVVWRGRGASECIRRIGDFVREGGSFVCRACRMLLCACGASRLGVV
ncbi:hypothetical protein C8J57DRAFT_1327264 [Mycena rebaudengoi]|nr:hypothetical protein C8J57DRAFT_1327264 [Mycena rebaudengoi]